MEMLTSPDVWVGLMKIIWIDLLVSGDNAVVIALAAQSLPPKQQKQVVIWGSAAAITMRIVLIFFAVQLLEIAWLKGVGAVLLIWIGVQLLTKEKKEEHVMAQTGLIGAIKTILVADLVMSLDNVLAVAAAADTAPSAAKIPLLVFGLGLSIPIVIFGSSLVLKLMERFPFIITLSAMLLGWIAGEMMAKEEVLIPFLPDNSMMHWFMAASGALLVLVIGKIIQWNKKSTAVEQG